MPSWNSGFSAILRGEATAPQLEGLKSAMLELLGTLRAEIPASYRHDELTGRLDQLLADGSTSLVVMGERGSGKSTLLVSVCGALIREGVDLVLPIMRPELFAENDSVISSFLASLWAHLARPTPEAFQGPSIAEDRVPREDVELLRLLTDTTRSQAASQTPLAALENATDSPSDFAEDAIAVSRSRVRLAWQLRELAQRLCMPISDDRTPRLVVVPIDDPDLAPSHVSKILRDLRVLGSVPGIVPITCLCPTDLVSAWTAEAENPRSTRTSGRLLHNYEREMEKLFPYRSRFTIEPQTAIQRVNFRPLTERVALGTKIRELRDLLSSAYEIDCHIDDALNYVSPSYGLPNPLPLNPRSLVQFWDVIDALTASDDPTDAMIALTLRRLLDLLSEPLRATTAPYSSDQLYEIAPFDPPGSESKSIRHDLTINLEDFSLFISAEGPFRAINRDIGKILAKSHADQSAVVTLRRLQSVRASFTRPNANHTSGKGDAASRQRLQPRETSSLLAIQEIAYGSGAFDTRGTRLFLGADEWSFLQTVTLGRLPTDDMFILLPEATTLAEVLRASKLWSQIVDRSEVELAPDLMMSAAIQAACSFLTNDDIGDSLPGYEATFSQASELYRQATASTYRTSTAFRQWYELDLPLQWHSAFFGADRVRSFCDDYRRALSSNARVTSSSELPLERFDARLKRILDAVDSDQSAEEHCWTAGYFDAAASLGSREVDRLSRLHVQWRDRTTSLRAGAAVAGGLVAEARGVRKLAPYPTPEGHELLGRALGMLRRRSEASEHRAQRA